MAVRPVRAADFAHYWLVLADATGFAGWFYVASGGLTHSTRGDTPSRSFTYAFATVLFGNLGKSILIITKRYAISICDKNQ